MKRIISILILISILFFICQWTIGLLKKEHEVSYKIFFDDNSFEIKEVYKAEVEFTVSGTREITFTDEIWFGKVGGRLVPFEYIEMWESDSWFQHMVITPEYIWENVKIAIE